MQVDRIASVDEYDPCTAIATLMGTRSGWRRADRRGKCVRAGKLGMDENGMPTSNTNTRREEESIQVRGGNYSIAII